MLERDYQAKLIKKIEKMFPACIVLKNDPEFFQGILDLTIFFEDRWAVLEVKPRENASERPNQRYYVELLNHMSFAAFIYPENEEEVLYDLQQAFGTRRDSRISKR